MLDHAARLLSALGQLPVLGLLLALRLLPAAGVGLLPGECYAGLGLLTGEELLPHLGLLPCSCLVKGYCTI